MSPWILLWFISIRLVSLRERFRPINGADLPAHYSTIFSKYSKSSQQIYLSLWSVKVSHKNKPSCKNHILEDFDLEISEFFCRRHYKMKFDIDPGYILDCSYNFTLVNLIRCRECKKTSLTSLCGTRYTVYGADIFFLFPPCL